MGVGHGAGIYGIRDRCLGTGCAVSCQEVRQIVLCVTCFAYSLLLLLLFLPLLSYHTVFISIHKFYFSSVLLPIPLRGREERVSSCVILVAGCRVKAWCYHTLWALFPSCALGDVPERHESEVK